MQINYNEVQVILICGNYNSGKSYLANKHFTDWIRINRNEIRRFLKTMTRHGESWQPEDYTPEEEHVVKHIERTLLRYYISQDKKVIVDNTSLSRRSRAGYIKEAAAAGAEIGCIFIQCPVKTLLERNRTRPKNEQTPENVISQLFAKTELPEKKEGFKMVSILES